MIATYLNAKEILKTAKGLRDANIKEYRVIADGETLVFKSDCKKLRNYIGSIYAPRNTVAVFRNMNNGVTIQIGDN